MDNKGSDMSILFGKKLNQHNGAYMHHCAGCDMAHVINVETPNGYTGAKWSFNNDPVAPTFSPSVLVRYSRPKGYTNENPAPVGWKGETVNTVCHYFITDGKIQYLGDCTHSLAGQTLELPDWQDDSN